MRGTRTIHKLKRLRTGLIPTYAGNTLPYLAQVLLVGAHPHVCGEHPDGVLRPLIFLGSSPRMRGTLSRMIAIVRWRGLIPTYAGNTLFLLSIESPAGAHPHVCGEHARATFAGHLQRGSSPRMRGTHLLTWGFIPTHQVLELVWSPKPVLTLHDFWAYRRREARLYLLALLHPFRGPSSSFGADGRIMSFTPSKSTGSHG